MLLGSGMGISTNTLKQNHFLALKFSTEKDSRHFLPPLHAMNNKDNSTKQDLEGTLKHVKPI